MYAQGATFATLPAGICEVQNKFVTRMKPDLENRWVTDSVSIICVHSCHVFIRFYQSFPAKIQETETARSLLKGGRIAFVPDLIGGMVDKRRKKECFGRFL